MKILKQRILIIENFVKTCLNILFNRGTSLSKIGETKNMEPDKFLFLKHHIVFFKEYLFLFHARH